MNGGVCGVGWSSGFGVMVVKLWELEAREHRLSCGLWFLCFISGRGFCVIAVLGVYIRMYAEYGDGYVRDL